MSEANCALAAAQAAADQLLRHRGEPTQLREKAPGDWLSLADLAAERAALEVIHEQFPTDAVQSEEASPQVAASRRWIVDPLDSTANYLRGIPIWSVSIALVDEARCLAGCVLHPLAGEAFLADELTAQADLANGARRAPPAGPHDTQIVVGLSRNPTSPARIADVSLRLYAEAAKVRSPGSPALGLAWTAAGRFDAAYYEMNFADWDVAAGAHLCTVMGLSVERRAASGTRYPRILAGRPEVCARLQDLLGR